MKLTNIEILEKYDSGENLQNIILIGDDDDKDLAGANLAGANLTGSVLAGADLTKAVLFGANLTKADLTGADLTGAWLMDATLTKADLTGADLTGANFRGAIVKGIILNDVKNREKAKNLYLNREVVKTDIMTIMIDSHGSCPLEFFLVPDKVNINTKADVGALCIVNASKSKNSIFSDSKWIKHIKGNIIPDFSLDTDDANYNKNFGIYVLKGGPLTCENYKELNKYKIKLDGCKDNNDDFLRITFDNILLSDLIKGLKEKFPEVEINIYINACNSIESDCVREIQCLNLTGNLSKKTTSSPTITRISPGDKLRRFSMPRILSRNPEGEISGYGTEYTKDQDFSAFREYDYSEEIEKNIKNSLLTDGGKKKMGRMLTETFNMKDVCFLLVCVYLFVENEGNEKKKELFDNIEATTEQEKYKAEIGKLFTFTNNIKFGRRRSQCKIKRRIDAKRRHKHNLRSIKKRKYRRGVST